MANVLESKPLAPVIGSTVGCIGTIYPIHQESLAWNLYTHMLKVYMSTNRVAARDTLG